MHKIGDFGLHSGWICVRLGSNLNLRKHRKIVEDV